MRFSEFNKSNLFEVNMSPSGLRRLAANIKNALVGIEFELCVPECVRPMIQDFGPEAVDQQMIQQQENMVPDFSYDDVIETTSAKEFYNSIFRFFSDHDANDSTRIDTAFDNALAAYELWILKNFPDDYSDEEFKKIMKNPDNIQEWLHSSLIDRYSTFAEEFDLNWPFLKSQATKRDIYDVSEDFTAMTGIPSEATEEYHKSINKSTEMYTLEPDTSIKPNELSDAGVEFVSHPMSLAEMSDQMHTVYSWAKEYGCYTNHTTGLHINLSIEGYDPSKLNYIKLVLLSGDTYIQQKFGRTANTYCRNFVKLFLRNKRRGSFDKLHSALNEFAKTILSSETDRKYSSINVQGNRVEFRSPGGDYLSRDPDEMLDIMYRYAVALDAAMDENKYREEYYKKLYKMLMTNNQHVDIVDAFAKFSSGKISKDQLVKLVATKELERAGKGLKQFELMLDGKPLFKPQRIISAMSAEDAINKILAANNLLEPLRDDITAIEI